MGIGTSTGLKDANLAIDGGCEIAGEGSCATSLANGNEDETG